jgi:NAD(P)-dependent dehydrogenase (short-subunit alcohol dehydrogenase family)
MEITGKTFLISGGGSGLGAATARTLANAGAKVVIADINENAGNAVVEELGADKALFVKTDVSDETSVQAAVDAAAGFGELRGAINCAGIGTAEKTVGKNGPHNLGHYMKVIQVNLVGTFNVIRLSAATMAKNEPTAGGERGIIINTASVAAFDGQIGQIAYSASKGGIVGMTLPAARDLSNLGIRVMTIAPGIFDTPLLGGLPEPVRESLGAQVPFPSRLGRPDEYAALAKHIVENEMLNGEVIRLDGAIRMAPR